MPELGPIHHATRSRHHLRRTEPGSRTFRHDRHVIAMHRVEGGHVGLGDEYLPVTGPFLALLPAGDADINDMHGHDDAWWCLFDGTAVASTADGVRLTLHGIARTMPRLHQLDATQARRAGTLFHELQTALAAGGLGGGLTALGRLSDLLALWLETGEPASDDAVTRFRALIEGAACDPARSLEALAAEAGRHPDTLGAAFRARFGCTPVAFRTGLRLQRARERLSAGDGSLAAIAVDCGFPDVGYFCRVFRRHVGLTPGAWARRFGGDR